MFSATSSVKSLFHSLSSSILSLKKSHSKFMEKVRSMEDFRFLSTFTSSLVLKRLRHTTHVSQCSFSHGNHFMISPNMVRSRRAGCLWSTESEEKNKKKKKKKQKKREIVLEIRIEGFQILEIGFQIRRKRIMGSVSESEGPKE
ncbi:LOW QUALITY PROTEIN: hypothetical protein TorRG33x02_190160 [Trema orientale]|uniref:Uncharacterized protein n=1 Tax=Trema orientale TaxID=63057 RepID=A0A2P5EHY5_TREOI|nr:LOW QUALITY PROTEIN: hypothetical protein TorRG33x02_190160 [Trema orientale]